MSKIEVVKFWAPWCKPCSFLSKELEGLDIRNINIDEEEGGNLAKDYKVRTIPTLIFIDEKGKELARRSGISSKLEVLDIINELEKRDESGTT